MVPPKRDMRLKHKEDLSGKKTAAFKNLHSALVSCRVNKDDHNAIKVYIKQWAEQHPHVRRMQTTADRTATNALISTLFSRFGGRAQGEERLIRDCFTKIVSGELWNLRRMERGRSAVETVEPPATPAAVLPPAATPTTVTPTTPTTSAQPSAASPAAFQSSATPPAGKDGDFLVEVVRARQYQRVSYLVQDLCDPSCKSPSFRTASLEILRGHLTEDVQLQADERLLFEGRPITASRLLRGVLRSAEAGGHGSALLSIEGENDDAMRGTHQHRYPPVKDTRLTSSR